MKKGLIIVVIVAVIAVVLILVNKSGSPKPAARRGGGEVTQPKVDVPKEAEVVISADAKAQEAARKAAIAETERELKEGKPTE